MNRRHYRVHHVLCLDEAGVSKYKIHIERIQDFHAKI